MQVLWHLQAGKPSPSGIYLSIYLSVYLCLYSFNPSHAPNTLLYLFQPGVFIFSCSFIPISAVQLLLICFSHHMCCGSQSLMKAVIAGSCPECAFIRALAAVIRPGHMETWLTSDLKLFAFFFFPPVEADGETCHHVCKIVQVWLQLYFRCNVFKLIANGRGCPGDLKRDC